MRGLSADSSWTHPIPGFIIAGIGSGMVNAPLALVAGVCALVLIRPKDFIVQAPASAGGRGSPLPATD